MVTCTDSDHVILEQYSMAIAITRPVQSVSISDILLSVPLDAAATARTKSPLYI